MRARAQKVTSSRQASFAFRVKSSPAFPFKWHFHPEYELTLILESSGARFVGDSNEPYDAGDLVLLGSNLPHTWLSDPSSPKGARHKAIVIHFAGDFLGEDFSASPEMKGVSQLLKSAARGLHFESRKRDEAAAAMLRMKKQDGLERLLGLLGVLQGLTRGGGRKLASPAFVPSNRELDLRRIDRVCTFINEHYHRRLSQPEAANVAGMTPQAFSRFFRKTVGKTFVDYLAELRVSQACRLLLETDISVVEVSLRSGFNNLSNCNRRFRRLRSQSPRRFRAAHQGDGARGDRDPEKLSQ